MKKPSLKKMSLSRETVLVLQDSQIETAVGGIVTVNCDSNAASCKFDSCPRTCSYTSC